MTERSLKELARETAVDAVDASYGYTVEFSPAPDFHRSQYDLAEARILAALQRAVADAREESLKLACEAVCIFDRQPNHSHSVGPRHAALVVECPAIAIRQAFAATQDDPEVSR